ncbi:peptide chain release factor N(5)-glutamine methyltransferase, partial [Candidatus Peregrinibacteria bacterium CG10_big_fil_rev_8_21_14_0_10_54_7]
MYIADALQEATLPALEREVLLASLLKKNRAWILAHGEHALSTAEEHTFHAWISRRKNHEPIAYITGKK